VKAIICERCILKFCTCRSLCFQLFISIWVGLLSLLLLWPFQHFTRKLCLEISGLRIRVTETDAKCPTTTFAKFLAQTPTPWDNVNDVWVSKIL